MTDRRRYDFIMNYRLPLWLVAAFVPAVIVGVKLLFA